MQQIKIKIFSSFTYYLFVNYVMKKIIPIILPICSIFVVTIFWQEISLPYNNSEKIIGEYSKNKHHQLNDTLRFICFLIFPLIIFTITYYFINKKNLNFYEIFKDDNRVFIENKENHKKKLYFVFFVIFLFVSLTSSNLPDHTLDIFHEGQLLSGALNYNLKNNLWIGSYINTGLFYDIINTKIFWNIFQIDSIGAYRFAAFSLNYLFLFFVIILTYKISSTLNFSKNLENLFFIIITIFCFYFYLIKSYNFPNYRDIFTIVFLICLINTFKNDKYKFLNYFIIGSLSISSLLWSLDRGIFLNATIIILLFFLLFKGKYKDLFSILISTIIFWVIFAFSVGHEEFREFIYNSFNILRYNEIWNGLIHPQPFSDEKNSTRATKALILYIINGIFIIKYFIQRNNKLNFNSKLLLGFIYLLGIFYYKIGLSRSDGGHIVIGSSINYILFVIIFLREILIVFGNKIKNKINLKSDLIITSLLIIFVFINFNQKKISKLENIINFKTRLIDFVSKKNDYFINEEYQSFLNKTKKLTEKYDCIQNFTYDPSMYYLLNKKSCTKYYLIFVMGTENDQDRFIEQIIKSKLDLIIVDKDNNEIDFTASIRFPKINEFLQKNFTEYKEVYKYKILKKINE